LKKAISWELQDVASDQQIAAPHIAITIDRNAAYRLGLSLSSNDQTLYDAFGQRQIANIYTSSRTYKLILEVQPQFQDDPAALSRIYLTGPTGSRVPLSAIAHFSTKVEPLTVNHQGQFPAVTLSFNVAPGHSLGQAVERIQIIHEQLHTPITLQGSSKAGRRSFSDL
jgi:multidrug efflux pump subunit AcrB